MHMEIGSGIKHIAITHSYIPGLGFGCRFWSNLRFEHTAIKLVLRLTQKHCLDFLFMHMNVLFRFELPFMDPCTNRHSVLCNDQQVVIDIEISHSNAPALWSEVAIHIIIFVHPATADTNTPLVELVAPGLELQHE